MKMRIWFVIIAVHNYKVQKVHHDQKVHLCQLDHLAAERLQKNHYEFSGFCEEFLSFRRFFFSLYLSIQAPANEFH